MEATRLREWEKSRQAELEAHRQVLVQRVWKFQFKSVTLEGDRESHRTASQERDSLL